MATNSSPGTTGAATGDVSLPDVSMVSCADPPRESSAGSRCSLTLGSAPEAAHAANMPMASAAIMPLTRLADSLISPVLEGLIRGRDIGAAACQRHRGKMTLLVFH